MRKALRGVATFVLGLAAALIVLVVAWLAFLAYEGDARLECYAMFKSRAAADRAVAATRAVGFDEADIRAPGGGDRDYGVTSLSRPRPMATLSPMVQTGWRGRIVTASAPMPAYLLGRMGRGSRGRPDPLSMVPATEMRAEGRAQAREEMAREQAALARPEAPRAAVTHPEG